MALPASADRYFAHLAAGRFDEAAACFSENGFYSHPAYDPEGSGPTSRRMEATGRHAIRALFEARGKREWVHESRSDSVGDRFYVEGRVREGAGAIEELLSYLAVGTLDADGRIASYIAYDARPPAGRAEVLP